MMIYTQQYPTKSTRAAMAMAAAREDKDAARIAYVKALAEDSRDLTTYIFEKRTKRTKRRLRA